MLALLFYIPEIYHEVTGASAGGYVMRWSLPTASFGVGNQVANTCQHFTFCRSVGSHKSLSSLVLSLLAKTLSELCQQVIKSANKTSFRGVLS
jgi:hypothetical protein